MRRALSGFLSCLRHHDRRTFIRANVVYNEYIINKQHVHLNGTRWTSLTGFLYYLQSKGLVDVKTEDDVVMVRMATNEEEASEEPPVEEERDVVQEVLQETMRQARRHGVEVRGVEETIAPSAGAPVVVAVAAAPPPAEKRPAARALFDDDSEDVREEQRERKRKLKMPITNPNQPPVPGRV